MDDKEKGEEKGKGKEKGIGEFEKGNEKGKGIIGEKGEKLEKLEKLEKGREKTHAHWRPKLKIIKEGIKIRSKSNKIINEGGIEIKIIRKEKTKHKNSIPAKIP